MAPAINSPRSAHGTFPIVSAAAPWFIYSSPDDFNVSFMHPWRIISQSRGEKTLECDQSIMKTASSQVLASYLNVQPPWIDCKAHMRSSAMQVIDTKPESVIYSSSADVEKPLIDPKFASDVSSFKGVSKMDPGSSQELQGTNPPLLGYVCFITARDLFTNTVTVASRK